MNPVVVKYAPLAADVFVKLYEKIIKKKDDAAREAELNKLLVENIAALSNENQLLKARVKTLTILTIASLVLAAGGGLLHFI